MPKFIRKPIVIEANQYLGGFEATDMLGVCVDPKCVMNGAHVHTIHKGQKVLLEKGDWVLPEPDGEHYYPVKDKIFRDTYEPLSESK